MALIAHEDRLVQTQTRPTVDVTKIVIWILAASLPWAAIAFGVKFVLGAVG